MVEEEINDNIHIHSFSGGIYGNLHCKHHLQSCLAMLQTTPRSTTEDIEGRKRITYRKLLNM